MTKRQFSMVLYYFGADTAGYAARLLGVSEEQIELWRRSPYRPAYWRQARSG